jgi:histidine triad (HIT) family protein
VVELACLENKCAGNGTEGSNPSLSASIVSMRPLKWPVRYNKRMQDSIFTKIIKGEIPSHKVYEDARTFVFMDIHPIQPGQVLVVPKSQAPFAWDLSDDDYRALMAAAKKVALKLRQVFPDKSHVGMQVEGLEIAHAHLKVFPFATSEEYHNHPDAQAEPDHDALAAIASKLRMEDDQ